MTGLQLLGAWLDVDENPDRKDEIFDSIYGCVGVYPEYTDWAPFIKLADAEEDQVAVSEEQSKS